MVQAHGIVTRLNLAVRTRTRTIRLIRLDAQIKVPDWASRVRAIEKRQADRQFDLTQTHDNDDVSHGCSSCERPVSARGQPQNLIITLIDSRSFIAR